MMMNTEMSKYAQRMDDIKNGRITCVPHDTPIPTPEEREEQWQWIEQELFNGLPVRDILEGKVHGQLPTFRYR